MISAKRYVPRSKEIMQGSHRFTTPKKHHFVPSKSSPRKDGIHVTSEIRLSSRSLQKSTAASHDATKELHLLTIGDPHFKTKNMPEMTLFAQRSLQLIDTLCPDAVVVLGDILDTHSKIDQVPAKLATEWLYHISLKTKLVILIGNHDRVNDHDFLSDQHPFTALKCWKNTLVVDTGCFFDVKGIRFFAMPYVPPGRFLEGIYTSFTQQGIPEEQHEDVLLSLPLIFAHQEFRGAKMGAFVSEIGDVWPEHFPYVISGHIHDAQTPQRNLRYVGTPLQHAFGDTQDKTVSLFTLRVTGASIEYHEECIDLCLKKKKVLLTNAEDFLDTKPQVDLEKTHLKWIIRGTRSELVALRNTDHYKAWKDMIDEHIIPDPPLQHKLPSDAIVGDTLDIFQGKSYMDIFRDQVQMSEDIALMNAFRHVFGPLL